jgi:hypothetical protein
LLDQLRLTGITWIAGLFDDPAALPTNPPAADVEHLNGGFQVVVCECNDVSVGAVAEDDGLFLQGPLQRAEVVAQSRGPLEVKIF